MSYMADFKEHRKLWEYVVGDPLNQCINEYLDHEIVSIMKARWYYLMGKAYEIGFENLKIAFKDFETGAWTTWKPFPGIIGPMFSHGDLIPAVDVHRSIYENEIIIESDYPTYEENWNASRIIGAILESKGFTPLYYYSGNKSIHIHVFLDWSSFENLNYITRTKLETFYPNIKVQFRNDFMRWLRAKIISCWDLGVREFDKDLVKATHLIRCELSRNKKGFKTFLGMTYKDMPPIPTICNENNGVYPRFKMPVLSRPDDPNTMVNEFVAEKESMKTTKKNIRLTTLFQKGKDKELRPCVKMILGEDFKETGDGVKRGLFILANELKRIFGPAQANIILDDWNNRLGNPLQESMIRYRVREKEYTLKCNFIHDFLKSIGMDPSQKCKGKV